MHNACIRFSEFQIKRKTVLSKHELVNELTEWRMSSWSELEHQFTETKLITPSLQLLSFVFKASFIQIWSVGSDYIQWSLQETEKRRRGYPSAQSALLPLICVFLKNLFTMGILKKFLETSILYLDTFSNVWPIPESSVIQFKHGTAFFQALKFHRSDIPNETEGNPTKVQT